MGKSKMSYLSLLVLCISQSGLASKTVHVYNNDVVDVSKYPSDTTFVFESKYYSDGMNYPNNQHQTNEFKRGSKCDELELTCPGQFYIEKTRRSCKDYLQISTDVKTTRYCGQSGPNIKTTSSKISTLFYSDIYGTKKGFRCEVTCSKPSGGSSGGNNNNNNNSGTCKCGIPGSKTRIVNGKESDINEHPWQVGLVQRPRYQRRRRYAKPFCGGTLVNNDIVVTADHCTGEMSPNKFVVRVGEHDLSSNSEAIMIEKRVIKIIRHPLANSVKTHDINLIKIDPVDFNTHKHVRPACLPTRSVPVGSEVVITGWGTLSSGGFQPDVLQEATVKVISNAECNLAYKGSIDKSMVCAKGSNKNGQTVDSCQGDSGGPMTFLENSGKYKGRYVLVGDVSFGIGCANPKYPGVYCRVFEIMDWIKKYVPNPVCN